MHFLLLFISDLPQSVMRPRKNRTRTLEPKTRTISIFSLKKTRRETILAAGKQYVTDYN